MLQISRLMNKQIPNINKLCRPAYLYMIYGILSIISSMYIIYSDSEINRHFRVFLQQYGIQMSNMQLNIFILGKISHTIFSVFIIDLLCRNKYHKLAWILIILTFMGDMRFIL